jgi:phage tail sheath protein FI
MAVALTNGPGVYVEEIPSGVRTITGVATSITLFVGWATKGPVNYPVLILSWADFVRVFGGFAPATGAGTSYLGYAVSHFFLNGGTQAYVLRVVPNMLNPLPAGAKVAAAATLAVDGLTFKAGRMDGNGNPVENPGLWAHDYGIAVKNQVDEKKNPTGRFRVQVVYAPPGGSSETVVESYENLGAIAPDPKGRYVIDVINKQSSFVTVALTDKDKPLTKPPEDTDPASPKLGIGDKKHKATAGDDGTPLLPSTDGKAGDFEAAVTALAVQGSVLDQIDLFNLVCVPGETVPDTLGALEKYCETRRAFLISDSDPVNDITKVKLPTNGKNSAFYFPWVQAPDVLDENRPENFPPCGFVAGIYARTDGTRGVWKAPAGTDASVIGASGLSLTLSDSQNGILNPLAVNCIRNFNVYGTVLWGARTMNGNDEVGSEWKYIPIRRTALFIEESLFRALKWVVFEPNDEPLWAEIRLNVGAFMQNLFRQGAFQGKTPTEAYFVKCDKETTTQNDINLGIVNIVVGFAPLKPAEFVIIKIQQMAGQIAT